MYVAKFAVILRWSDAEIASMLKQIVSWTLIEEFDDTVGECWLFGPAREPDQKRPGRLTSTLGRMSKTGYHTLSRPGTAGKDNAPLAHLALFLNADTRHDPDAHILNNAIRTRMQAAQATRTQLDASHLCHRKNCIAPHHLTLEPTHYNKSRNYCPKQCPHGTNMCHHMPLCARRGPYFEHPGGLP